MAKDSESGICLTTGWWIGSVFIISMVFVLIECVIVLYHKEVISCCDNNQAHYNGGGYQRELAHRRGGRSARSHKHRASRPKRRGSAKAGMDDGGNVPLQNMEESEESSGGAEGMTAVAGRGRRQGP
ncbi:hypothetical protein T439DRAFT_360796 [Meredithblackwellia eburnea MCA 4105]